MGTYRTAPVQIQRLGACLLGRAHSRHTINPGLHTQSSTDLAGPVALLWPVAARGRPSLRCQVRAVLTCDNLVRRSRMLSPFSTCPLAKLALVESIR